MSEFCTCDNCRPVFYDGPSPLLLYVAGVLLGIWLARRLFPSVVEHFVVMPARSEAPGSADAPEPAAAEGA